MDSTTFTDANSWTKALSGLTQISELLSKEGTPTNYKDVSYVANVITKAKADIDEAMNIADIVAIVDKAKVDALAGLKKFMNNTLTELKKLDNASGYYLTGRETAVAEFEAECNKEDATAATLVTKFEAMVNAATERDAE